MTVEKANRMIALGNIYQPSDEFTKLVTVKFIDYKQGESLTEEELAIHLETIWIAWNAVKELVDREKGLQ